MTDERNGLDKLRAAIDTVATDIESRRGDRGPRARWVAPLALGAAAVLVVLLLGYQGYRVTRPPRSTEVEVLVLRVHGRDVRARVVDDTAPGTIIIMPQAKGGPAAPPSATALMRGATR